jgi:hypothetical protein
MDPGPQKKNSAVRRPPYFFRGEGAARDHGDISIERPPSAGIVYNRISQV